MIRHSCAACGKAINRTDRFFEPSDGTLCQDCRARMGGGDFRRAAVMPPALALLPKLAAPARH